MPVTLALGVKKELQQIKSAISQKTSQAFWMEFSDLLPYKISRTIPAAFFDRFFLWSFCSSSTLPRLVCLAYVQGFYFLFCCVEVSSVVLCLLCCVALCCNPLCCVALCCVTIHCVVSVLLRCVALCCDPLCRYCVVSVGLRCVVLRCDPLCCVALCCVVLLTSSAFLVFRLC